MASRHQSGQVLVETLITFVFFAGLFLALQMVIENHKKISNSTKLSRETKYEIYSTNKK